MRIQKEERPTERPRQFIPPLHSVRRHTHCLSLTCFLVPPIHCLVRTSHSDRLVPYVFRRSYLVHTFRSYQTKVDSRPYFLSSDLSVLPTSVTKISQHVRPYVSAPNPRSAAPVHCSFFPESHSFHSKCAVQ